MKIGKTRRRAAQLAAAILVCLLLSATGFASGPVSAARSSSQVYLNDSRVSITGCNIGGNNYYRLRDLAAAFRGTSSSFDVTWNGETKQVEVLTGRDYTGEAESGGLSWWGASQATLSSSRLVVDGRPVDVTAYNIDGSNYYKLRDLSEALSFAVCWEQERDSILLYTLDEHTSLAESSGGAARPAVFDAFPFTDVEESRWFRPAVEAAYNAGLVKGLTDTTYGPQNTLTLAESVTLAARIYAEAHGETAPSGGTPWYKTAYDYCVEKGIIDGAVFALDDMTRTATRFEMVTILDGAVPAQRMDNSVAVESIPDLAETDAYGEMVYRWYRAGILTGNADGSFAGERSITRAEVAQILCTINRLI